MTETERRALRLLNKYDKMRVELRELERELTLAVRDFAAEQKLGWFDKDKFRARQMTIRDMQKRKAA